MAEIKPPPPPGWPGNPGEVVTNYVDNPHGPGGWYVSNIGGIAAVGGAPFYGSYPGLSPDQRQGSRTFNLGTLVVDKWGMTLYSDAQEAYRFGAYPPADPPPKTPDPNQSARAIIDSTLNEYGLGGLGDWAWKEYLKNSSIEQVIAEVRKRPEYAARFPGMAELAKKGRAISEQQYIELERSYTQVARAAGLPTGIYDRPDDFARLIGGEVSPQEWAGRVDLAARAAFQAPPEWRDEMRRLYGYSAGDFTAIFLDPDRALNVLEQQFVSGQIASQAIGTGYGTLTRDEAERLAKKGVSDEQAREAFGKLAEASELFGTLPGQDEQAIGRGDQLDATFDGNAAALERIRRRQAKRRADFADGGAFAAGRDGVAGLGSAAT